MFQHFKMMPYKEDMPKGRPTDAPRTEFGSRLVELREKRGLTQSQVAASLKVSSRAYAFWERKPVALHAVQIARLADIFEVSADVIVGRDALKPKRNGPKGKLEKLFEVARDLPRSQQEKITAVLEPFVNEHASA
jgi:transcriptional regulator with XRE-family HTH domain